jgi:hypothetical protein
MGICVGLVSYGHLCGATELVSYGQKLQRVQPTVCYVYTCVCERGSVEGRGILSAVVAIHVFRISSYYTTMIGQTKPAYLVI